MGTYPLDATSLALLHAASEFASAHGEPMRPIHLLERIMSDRSTGTRLARETILAEAATIKRLECGEQPTHAPAIPVAPWHSSLVLREILDVAECERVLRRNTRINPNHLAIAILSRDEESRRFIAGQGGDPARVIRELQSLTGSGLRPSEMRMSPQARRISVWDLPEAVRRDRDVLSVLELLAAMSDDEYQQTPFVQAAMALDPKDSDELTELVRLQILRDLGKLS